MKIRSVIVLCFVFVFSLTASASQIFSDDFNDGDLSGWTQKRGDWTLSGGSDKYISSNSNYGVIWKDGSFGVDQKMQVDAYFDINGPQADQIAHLRLRTGTGTDSTDFWNTGYMAEVQIDTVRVYSLHGGLSTPFTYNFGTSPIDSTGWYTIGFEVTGTGSDTHFKVSIDDILYIDEDYINPIAQLDSGYIGLGREMKYDNFQSATDVAIPEPCSILLSAIGAGCVRYLKKRRSIIYTDNN